MDKLQAVKMVVESAATLSVVSYFVQKYVAEPRGVLEKLVADVDADLVFFASMWANPSASDTARGLDAQDSFRRHAANIRAAIRGTGGVRKLFLFGLPSLENFRESSNLLILISSSIIVSIGEEGEAAERNRKAEAKVRSLLKIPEAGD